jgi:hypothetical protein
LTNFSIKLPSIKLLSGCTSERLKKLFHVNCLVILKFIQVKNHLPESPRFVDTWTWMYRVSVPASLVAVHSYTPPSVNSARCMTRLDLCGPRAVAPAFVKTTVGCGIPVPVQVILISSPSVTGSRCTAGSMNTSGACCTTIEAVTTAEPAAFSARHSYSPPSLSVISRNLSTKFNCKLLQNLH